MLDLHLEQYIYTCVENKNRKHFTEEDKVYITKTEKLHYIVSFIN